ncbi:MAG: hypothetical protein K2H48_01460 [Duncaniella sp.]|nr:hypothetical protein [Duncaniella sp.]
MDLDYYFVVVKGKKQTPCIITLKNGNVMEGVYTGETAPGGLLLNLRPTGETREQCKNVGISDPNPDIAGGDTLEVEDLGIAVSEIESIEFTK